MKNFGTKDYAKEAYIAWLDYGLKQLEILQLNAYTHSENGPSNHVL